MILSSVAGSSNPIIMQFGQIITDIREIRKRVYSFSVSEHNYILESYKDTNKQETTITVIGFLIHSYKKLKLIR